MLFAMPSEGWSFHDPRKSTGRLMPVSQSIVLWKLPFAIWLTSTESLGSRVARLGTRAPVESGACPIWSVTCTELAQLNDPKRTGVSKLNAVTRVSAVRLIVSTTPPGRIRMSEDNGSFEVVLLVKLSPGDQVMSEPTAIGTGDNVTAGKSCCTLPSVMLCRRLPPRVSVPQPKRLE